MNKIFLILGVMFLLVGGLIVSATPKFEITNQEKRVCLGAGGLVSEEKDGTLFAWYFLDKNTICKYPLGEKRW
jgi:hypothetical protein